MAYSLILLQNRLVSLAVLVTTLGITALVEEELGHIQILLLSGHGVQLGQCHLCNLMSGYADHLIRTVANLTAHAVSILDCNVQEIALARSLIVGYCTLNHMTQVIELMAQVLNHAPACWACPLVRMLGVHGTGRVKVTVRLLCGSHHLEHTVNIELKFLVRIGLQQIACSLYGLIDIGVVKRVTAHLESKIMVSVHLLCRLGKVVITARLLTLAECQRYGNLTAGLEALAPERVLGHLHVGKRNGVCGIATALLLCREAYCCYGKNRQKEKNSSHI